MVIPVIGFLIFVHELGHFATAKWFGIKVTEFGFGFPPRLFGIRRGETVYSINLVPLGGFVKMVGEEDPSDPRSFARQSVLRRTIVLTAGPLMNLLVPVIVFTVLFALPRDTVVGPVVIGGVAPRSPADEAGLRTGDTIIRADGKRIDNHADLMLRIMAKLGSDIELVVRKGSIVAGMSQSPEFSVVESVLVESRLKHPDMLVVEEVTDPSKEVTPTEARRYDASLKLGDPLTQGPTGILIGTTNPRLVKKRYPVWEAVPMSFKQIWDLLLITKNVTVRWAGGGPDPGFAGPIGIAQVTGEVAKAGVLPLFELGAFISISLGIVNILPIPALDGGRLMFVLLEWARRGKRISPQREGLVHLVGFAMVVGLIFIMSYRDIVRIVSGESFIP